MTTPTVAPRVKKLINRVDDVVPESLAGLGAAHPAVVQIDAANRVVLRAGGPKRGKVGLVSGGGSGHEPLTGIAGRRHRQSGSAGAVTGDEATGFRPGITGRRLRRVRTLPGGPHRAADRTIVARNVVFPRDSCSVQTVPRRRGRHCSRWRGQPLGQMFP